MKVHIDCPYCRWNIIEEIKDNIHRKPEETEIHVDIFYSRELINHFISMHDSNSLLCHRR